MIIGEKSTALPFGNDVNIQLLSPLLESFLICFNFQIEIVNSESDGVLIYFFVGIVAPIGEKF